MLDEEDYGENYRKIRALCPKAAMQYVGMVYLDALVFNMDRHTNNYGFLRDRQTGEVLGLAPLFDHNIALVARGYSAKAAQRGGMFSTLFVDLLRDEPQALSDFLALGLTPPTPEMVQKVIRLSNDPPFPSEVVREDYLIEFVLSAQEWMEEKLGLCQEPELEEDEPQL